MNPTVSYFWHRVRGVIATIYWAILKLVKADLRAAPPAPGTLFNGQATLLARCAGPSGNLPYYRGPTVLAAVLALVLGWGAYLLASDPEPGAWNLQLALCASVLCALCIYHAIARRQGPTVIDQDRYQQACTALADSGDAQARPIPVLVTVAMAAMLMVDGAYTGYTLSIAAFGSLFTPRMAQAAALAFSCAMAWLLFHLTSTAAREGTINARRAVVRRLLAAGFQPSCGSAACSRDDGARGRRAWS